jgi:hypothetical protein
MIFCLESQAAPESKGEALGWGGAGRKKGKLDFIFFLWAVVPDSKHCPGFLIREIREIRA